MAQKHPRGLKALFFTEMWERLGFYLMLGILYLYITDTERGGLGFTNASAGEIYGTYLAFVYFTPFIGGMIADRILGFRRSVAIGGVLMAAGYFSLGVRTIPTFYLGLVLLCVGNGFFKPNISAMVGNLYEPDDERRDAGFNIFYMGINIGATISALLAAPLRNLWSFNMAFSAAGVGLIIGTTVLVLNWKKLAKADVRAEASTDDVSLGQVFLTILMPAFIFGAAGYLIGKQLNFVTESIGPVTFGFIVGMLPIIVYFLLIVKRATPEEKPGLGALIPVYIAGGAFFMVLHLSGGLMTVFAEHDTNRQASWMPKAMDFYAQKAMPSYYFNADESVARPDRRMLYVVDENGEAMFGARILSESVVQALRDDPSQSVEVVDAASAPEALKNFVLKVYPDENVAISREKDAHGVESTSVREEPENLAPTEKVVLLRELEGLKVPVLLVTQKTMEKVYANATEATPTLPPGDFLRLLNAELITGFLNPFFVVLLTPLVVGFFSWLAVRKKEVTTARKIFLGMVITMFSILIMALAAYLGHNGAAKVSMLWLVFYYLLITTGELCLSPMGLSLVTKLSPKRLVGLMMGGWFLATSIGNKLSGFISGLEPTTQIFIILAIAIGGVAAFLFALLPKLDAAIHKYGA